MAKFLYDAVELGNVWVRREVNRTMDRLAHDAPKNSTRAVFKEGGVTGSTPPPEMLKKFNKYSICLCSKVLYEDAHKQAPRSETAATVPPDTFLSRKNAFAAGAPQLVMGEGPPGKGEGKREKGEGKG